MVQQPPGPPPGGMQPPPPPPPGPPGMPPQAPMARPRPQFDMSNLPIAEIVVAVCALILVIMSGVGWYKSDIKGVKNGDYDIFMKYIYEEEPSVADFYDLGLGGGAMSVLTMVVGILLLVFALVMIANRYLNFIPMQLPTGLIYLGGVALILLFMVLGIFVKPGFSVGGFGIGEYYRELGEFAGGELGKAALSWPMWIISLIFALGIGAGGALKTAES